MLLDFLVKSFVQLDDIREIISGQWLLVVVAVISELHLVEKVEAGPIRDDIFFALIFRAKENRCPEDPLEPVHNPFVMVAVLRQFEIVEHLRGAVKADGPALLQDGERGRPDRHQAV
jgi:hypothetical protein